MWTAKPKTSIHKILSDHFPEAVAAWKPKDEAAKPVPGMFVLTTWQHMFFSFCKDCSSPPQQRCQIVY